MSQLDDQDQPLLSLIQELKSGTMNGKVLPPELRQQIVEVCILQEGYNVSQTAQLLQRSEKTIQRDLKHIRAKNAVKPSVDLAMQMIGELIMKARIHNTYLMRLARSKGGNIGEKSQAEFAAWRVSKELVEKLQTLGYLPLRPQEVVGDLFHHFENDDLEKSFEEARKSLDEVIDVAAQCGNLTPELKQHIDHIHQRIEKAEIVQKTETLVHQAQEIREDHDEKQN